LPPRPGSWPRATSSPSNSETRWTGTATTPASPSDSAAAEDQCMDNFRKFLRHFETPLLNFAGPSKTASSPTSHSPSLSCGSPSAASSFFPPSPPPTSATKQASPTANRSSSTLPRSCSSWPASSRDSGSCMRWTRFPD
jgi:hypothetical protein